MISRLEEKIKKTGAPVVVGLDPNLSFVPQKLQKEAYEDCGETAKGASSAILAFNRGIIDAVCDIVPAVKLQIAMYEQFGSSGIKAYQKSAHYAKKKGLLVIGDGKRGDIGSTSDAYAAGHLGRVEVGSRSIRIYEEDFTTVNPYLGTDGVEPFLSVCKEEDKGIFVLVKTSNPSGKEFQDLMCDGTPLYERVAERVTEWGSGCMDGSYSDVGAVVGATYPKQGARLRKKMPHTFFLVPGYGAQGAKAADLLPLFDEEGSGAVVNSSRGIIAAYQQPKYRDMGMEESNFADAAREAAEEMIKDLSSALHR